MTKCSFRSLSLVAIYPRSERKTTNERQGRVLLITQDCFCFPLRRLDLIMGHSNVFLELYEKDCIGLRRPISVDWLSVTNASVNSSLFTASESMFGWKTTRVRRGWTKLTATWLVVCSDHSRERGREIACICICTRKWHSPWAPFVPAVYSWEGVFRRVFSFILATQSIICPDA